MILLDTKELIKYIKEQKKRTPVKVFCQGHFNSFEVPDDFKVFSTKEFLIIFGEYSEIMKWIETNKDIVLSYYVEYDRRSSAMPLKNLLELNARIEPGAIIREKVEIGERAIVLMGSVVNVGASIGEGTMIDMNAVIGARAIVGKNCHIGAGAVVAGVLEPISKDPVIIEDNVVIGANAVILEGVKVGRGAIVAAGAVVTVDVLANSVVAGMPAKIIKDKDELTEAKTKIAEDLRDGL